MSEDRSHYVLNCALPYANSALHIGHIAGAYLPGDIFNRFLKIAGKNTLFICGTDEYGTPVTIRAEKDRTTPQKVVDRYHQEIREDLSSLDIKFDFFGRTTGKYHERFVQEFFQDLNERGFLEKKLMTSAFCPREERFLPDRYVNGQCPNCGFESARGDQCDECGKTIEPQELINPVCAICGATVEFRETEHIFFKISQMDAFLKSWLLGKKDWRNNVINFSMNIIEGGLRDRPITRDMDWGVPIGEAGMENKRIYVWFEALLGYLSNAQEYSRLQKNDNLWKEYYDDEQTYYFMGKDNIFFHAIFLPAMHKASGKYPLPYRITANEYLRYKGQKFSKSREIGFTLREILTVVDKDSLRYYVSSILPETSDSDFSQEEMIEKVNSELNGKYGNLVNRVVSFCSGKSIAPKKGEPDHSDIELMTSMENFRETFTQLMTQVEFRKALSLWLENVKIVNSYFNDAKPWDLVKSDRQVASSKLWYALKAIEYLTMALAPFVPSGSARAWDSIHQSSMENIQFSHLAETCTFNPKNEAKIFKRIEIGEGPVNQLNLVIGKILNAENHPDADSLLHLRVSLGDHEIDLVAGLRKYYKPEELKGKKIVVVENLKHAKLRGIVSQGMLLAAQDSNGAHILTSEAHEGTKVSMGKLLCESPEKIDLDIIKGYDLKVIEDHGEMFPTAVIGRERVYLEVDGKRLTIDGPVENKSTIR